MFGKPTCFIFLAIALSATSVLGRTNFGPNENAPVGRRSLNSEIPDCDPKIINARGVKKVVYRNTDGQICRGDDGFLKIEGGDTNDDTTQPASGQYSSKDKSADMPDEGMSDCSCDTSPLGAELGDDVSDSEAHHNAENEPDQENQWSGNGYDRSEGWYGSD